ncbi:FecCD family ABC transporter permease [Amycolatopsis sp. cg5]|uniref:FecCD family ABC transporter permease n=1 Tax=Amycolatopsis sp. cg5 TaxID=3238802 RepID=UPI003524CED4
MRGTRSRMLAGISALAVVLVGCCFASLALGSQPIPLGTVVDALLRPQTIESHIVVRSLRVPRTELGVLAGVALGLAGALTQAHTRNPLADPGVLGVSAGAAFFVVVGIYVFGISTLYGYIWFAFAGAIVASAGVFAIGSARGGGVTPVRLVLAGAAVTALLNALTSALVINDEQTLNAFRFWSVGALEGRDAAVVGEVVWFVVLGAVLALAGARGLNALALGEDMARSLGQHIPRTRVLGLVAITLLVGAATAACGPIAFVGLVVPHAVRAFTGPDYRWLLPFSALAGAILLLVADVLGRVLARPQELQVGIVVAVLGAPFFVLLVRRRRVGAL